MSPLTRNASGDDNDVGILECQLALRGVTPLCRDVASYFLYAQVSMLCF